jgi:hypothetical protein
MARNLQSLRRPTIIAWGDVGASRAHTAGSFALTRTSTRRRPEFDMLGDVLACDRCSPDQRPGKSYNDVDYRF